MTLAEIRKAIAALLTAIGTWGVTAAAEGGIAAGEWFGVLVAIGGAGAVWGIANGGAGDDGATDLELAMGIVLLAVALAFLYLTLR